MSKINWRLKKMPVFVFKSEHFTWFGRCQWKKKRMQSVKAFDYGKFFSLSHLANWFMMIGMEFRKSGKSSYYWFNCIDIRTSNVRLDKKNLQKSRKKSFSFSFGEQKNGDRFTRIEWVVQFGCWLYALVFAHSVYVHFFPLAYTQNYSAKTLRARTHQSKNRNGNQNFITRGACWVHFNSKLPK